MIYTVRVKATKRNLGDYDAPDPCQALAAMLVARGVSSGSGDLLARVLDGLEAVPVARDFAETLAGLGSRGYAEAAGHLAGLEFAAAIDGAGERYAPEPALIVSDVDAFEDPSDCHACGGSGEEPGPGTVPGGPCSECAGTGLADYTAPDTL